MKQPKNTLPELDLPNRWEKLQRKAKEIGIDATEFVERVDAAAKRIDELLGVVRSSGGGVFEILLGLSGSGKTTFVNSLPRFFKDIEVTSVPVDLDLRELPSFISSKYVPEETALRIFLIERRDNPNQETLNNCKEIFSGLLDFFRTAEGSCLILWTITDDDAANRIAATAWQVGRDSVCDRTSRGLYQFTGLEKQKYAQVADDTAKNLCGDGLEAFGIPRKRSLELLKDCETLSDFYGKLVNEAETVRGQTWSVLKERIHPKLWIVLPGDTRQAINSTVRALTQGTRSRIDIDLICEFIDDPLNNAVYVEEWKKRRSSIAHLFRAFDVRLFALPPNVAVAAVRCFGDDLVKGKLVTKVAAKSTSADALRSTRVYKEIIAELGGNAGPHAERGKISSDTEDEYRRIQAQAASTDKPLNKALGLLFTYALEADLPAAEIGIEKRGLSDTPLQPDITIRLSATDVICIEPTWRSSGEAVGEEIKERQNTLAEGHLKQYILNKTLDYVKALGL